MSTASQSSSTMAVSLPLSESAHSSTISIILPPRSPADPQLQQQPVDTTAPPEGLISDSDVDPAILEALKSAKERLYVLKLGESMESLIMERTARTRLELVPTNPYQRLLVHRCAAYYKLTPESDTQTKTIAVNVTIESRIPARRLAELIPADSAPLPTFKIMRRSANDKLKSSKSWTTANDDDSDNGEGEGSSEAGGSSGKGKKTRMTIAEREAAYNEARSRIFMDFEEKQLEREDTLTSNASASSSQQSLLIPGSTSGGGSPSPGATTSATSSSKSSVSGDTLSESSYAGTSAGKPKRNGSGHSSRSNSVRTPATSTGTSFSRDINPTTMSAAPFAYPSLYDPSQPQLYDPSAPTTSASNSNTIPSQLIPPPPPPGYPPYYHMYPPYGAPPMMGPAGLLPGQPYPMHYPYLPYPPYGHPYTTPPPPPPNTDPNQVSPPSVNSGSPATSNGSTSTPPTNGVSYYPHPPLSPYQGGANPYLWTPSRSMQNLPQQHHHSPSNSQSSHQPSPQHSTEQFAYYPYPPYPYMAAPPPQALYNPVDRTGSTPSPSTQSLPLFRSSGPSSPDSQNPPWVYPNRQHSGPNSRNGSRDSMLMNKGRGANPPPHLSRGPWNYGPGVGSTNGTGFGTMGMERRKHSNGGSSGPGSVSGGSGSGSGARTPAEENCSIASSSTSSSSSRRTYTSSSSKHPLPPRPDWAVGLKPTNTLAPSMSARPHKNSSGLGGTQQPPSLHSGEFPPLPMHAEKAVGTQSRNNTNAAPSGSVWNSAANRSLLLSPPPPSQSPPQGGPPRVNGSSWQDALNPPTDQQNRNLLSRLDDVNEATRRPPPKASAELFNPRGGRRPGSAPAEREPDKEARARGEAVANAILVERMSNSLQLVDTPDSAPSTDTGAGDEGGKEGGDVSSTES